MKQYTTPTITIDVPGQENLLAIAERIVVAAKPYSGEIILWEGESLSVEGDTVSWSLSEDETAALEGTSSVELTIFNGDKVYKTDTTTLTVAKAVWDNGRA